MEMLNKYKSLRQFCKEYEWPRINQFNHWIYSNHPIALHCIKKIGGRYVINVEAFTDYINKASLSEVK